jgi:hypothetical protein
VTIYSNCDNREVRQIVSNYQQMSEAAETARKNYLAYQQRAWEYFFKIINGLIEHCGVPQDHIAYLKWNGLEGGVGRFRRSEDGGQYTLPGAVTYDIRDNSFNLGVLTYLTPANVLPRQHVSFALWINEKNGLPVVRVGIDGKPLVVRLDDPDTRNAYCSELAKEIVEAFSTPLEQAPKSIGFDIGSRSS